MTKKRKAPPGAKSPAKPVAPAAPTIKVVNYIVFAFKGSAQGVKSAIPNEAAGHVILKEVYFAINEGKPYFNEERGLLINASELSNVYLTQEQVQ